MKIARLLACLCTMVCLIISCNKSGFHDGQQDPCDVMPKTFAANASPLFQTYCNQSTCHDAGSVNGPGPLTNYNQVFNARAAIRGAIDAGIMPKNTTLSTIQKNTIICWIDSGAPNN